MSCFEPWAVPGAALRSAFLLVCLPATLAAAEPQALTRDGKLKFSPTFTPDQTAVLYSLHERPNLVSITRVDLATKKSRRLFPLLVGSQFDPSMSRDGRYLCFAQSAGNPQLVLTIKDLVDNKEYTFSPGNDRMGVRGCSIAPDGKRVYFSISQPGGQQIASVDMEGKNLVKATQAAGIHCAPAVSPDGRKIAFASSREGDLEIYVADIDGSDPTRITTSPGLDTHPAWSPDGNRLAFTSNRDGNYEIYLCNADGTDPVNLTRHPERDDFPSWRPDGGEIVCVSERDGKFDLYVYPPPR